MSFGNEFKKILENHAILQKKREKEIPSLEDFSETIEVDIII